MVVSRWQPSARGDPAIAFVVVSEPHSVAFPFGSSDSRRDRSICDSPETTSERVRTYQRRRGFTDERSRDSDDARGEGHGSPFTSDAGIRKREKSEPPPIDTETRLLANSAAVSRSSWLDTENR